MSGSGTKEPAPHGSGTRSRITLYLVTFAIAAGSSLPFGVMDDLRRHFDLTRTATGVIAAAGFVGALISQLVLARFADRGYARQLILGGAIAAACSLAAFALVDSWPGFVGARLIGGLSAGALLPAARSMVVRADPKRSAERIGELAGFEVAGFVVGPIIGNAGAGISGIDAPFLAMAGFLALLMPVLMVARFPDAANAATPDSGAQHTGGIGTVQLLSMRPVRLVVLASIALFLPVGIYEALWQSYLNDVGATRLEFIVSLIVFALPLTALSWLGGRWVQRQGSWRVLRRCVWGVFLATALYGVLEIPWLIVVVGGIEALLQAGTGPAVQSAMVDAAPARHLAQAQGLALAGNQVAAGLAALIGAWAYGEYGAGPAFIGAAAVMSLLWAYVDRGQRALERERLLS